MQELKSKIAWDLMTELRKETLEAQRMRTQVIGFKITFVSTGIGLIYANKAPRELLALPAFASVFFDLLIISYSISIRRIGLYCRKHLERQIDEEVKASEDFCYWEKFFELNQIRPILPIIANLGITILALVVGITGLYQGLDANVYWFSTLIVLLLLLFLYDFAAFLVPARVTNERPGRVMWLFFENRGTTGEKREHPE